MDLWVVLVMIDRVMRSVVVKKGIIRMQTKICNIWSRGRSGWCLDGVL
jgi:hypothetical protein